MLEVHRVACTKCDRVGRYDVAKLIERYGPDGSLPEWRHEISKDCTKRANDRLHGRIAQGGNNPVDWKEPTP